MSPMERFTHLANQLQAEEPEVPAEAIPYHARSYTGGFYVCAPGCGKLFRDVASKNRHQAQYCRSARESERCVSSSRLMGS
jgi:hypothetical protein